MKKIYDIKCLQLLLIMIICALSISVNAQAKTQKQKTLAAYKKMLSRSDFKYLDGDKELGYCRFATAYIDNDNIPELLVMLYRNGNGGDNATLYTYKNGKVKEIGSVDDVDCFDKNSKVSYIKKGNLILDTYDDDISAVYTQYKIVSSGKLKEIPYYIISSIDKKGFFDFNKFSNHKSGKKLSSTVYTQLRSDNSGYRTYKILSKSSFNKAIKKYTKSKKFRKFAMHKNTKSNRDKYLR